MTRRAKAAGALLIWRTQARSVRRVLVRDGKAESSSVSSISGNGVQVVTPEDTPFWAAATTFKVTARSRCCSGPSLLPPPGLDWPWRRALSMAWSPPKRGRSRSCCATPKAWTWKVSGGGLAELESEIAAKVPGTSLKLSFKAELDAWRIFRSDGTDVLFAIPRCNLGVRATSSGNGARHGVSASVFTSRPEDLWEGKTRALFMSRALNAAGLARDLPDAPPHPAGSFPLVIDYALAKGLAHEAFGHAAEADGFRSSILAEHGRFRTGHPVGAEHISIIDEPLEGDHAWQPYSANGVERGRATLVDHGRLADGLSDPWSAKPGGVRMTGAARRNPTATPRNPG